MSSPVPSAEYTIPIDQYAPEALATLVNHTELTGSTMSERNISDVLAAFVLLGRVAIARGDAEAYQGWTEHATTLVDQVQLRGQGDYEKTQFYAYVTELNFFGVMDGQVDAADRLHSTLAAATDIESMHRFMRLCAQYDVNPTAWIEQHNAEPDERAFAWGTYMSTKRLAAQDELRNLTHEELHVPGIEHFIQDVIIGNLSAKAVIGWAATAYRAAANTFEKRQIISRYGLALSELATSDEGLGRSDVPMMEFATMVNCDPDIPHVIKVDLSTQVMPELPPTTDLGRVQPRTTFELSVAIEAGADVPQLLAQIEEVILVDDHPYRRSDMRDYLLRQAAEHYIDTGQFERAAAMTARITRTFHWQYAIEHYARAGGDISLARQTDTMRQIFDDVPASDSPIYGPPQWRVREQISTFLTQIAAGSPDFVGAREIVLQMAEDVGNGSMPENAGVRRDVVSQIQFETSVGRLLEADSDAVSIGPRVLELLSPQGSNIYLQRIYELFGAHGSTELLNAGWEQIQANPRDRATYLSYYSRLALASAGVVQ